MLLLLPMLYYDFLYGMPVLIGVLGIGLYLFIGAPDMLSQDLICIFLAFTSFFFFYYYHQHG